MAGFGLTRSLESGIPEIAATIPQSVVVIEASVVEIFGPMVFPRGKCAVASVSQDLAERHRVSHLAMGLIHSALLGVYSCQQAGPGGEALGGVVHLRESNAILG